MIIQCPTCEWFFEDLYRSTLCPHNVFLANDGLNNFSLHHDAYCSTLPPKDTGRKFESHITCPRDQSVLVEAHASILGMSYSAIDGDPVMGKQAYCYLTCYDEVGERLKAKVHRAAYILTQAGVTVLREKVEEIIYDSKTGHNRFGSR